MVVRPSTFNTVWELWARSAGPKLRNIGPQVTHRTKGAFKFTKPSGPIPSAPQPSQLSSAVNSFLTSVHEGVFKSFKSGGNYNGRLVKSQQNNRGFDNVILSSRTRARPHSARFGPSPRPTSHPSHVSHVGLGVARNFSSARPIFDNIVQNVPLGLRALVDQGGIDERKWRSQRRSIRQAQLAKGKGKSRMDLPEKENWNHEFANYFDSPSPVAPEADTPSIATLTHPIILSLPLEPSLSLSSPASSFHDTTQASYRLLSPSTLQAFLDIESSYLYHSRLIRALSNRLSSAGVFDDPDVRVDMLFRQDGYKEVQVAFGGRWTVRDVRQAAGVWGDVGDSGGFGGSDWFEIKDLREGQPFAEQVASQDLQPGLGHDLLLFDYLSEDESEDATPALSVSPSESDLIDSEEVHNVVASTFHLPSFYTPSASLSEFDSALSDTSEESFSPIRPMTPEPSHWDDISSPLSPSLSSSVTLSQGEMNEDLRDLNGWELESFSDSFSVSEEREESIMASYESGVRDFLRDLDEVQDAYERSDFEVVRERRERPAFFARM